MSTDKYSETRNTEHIRFCHADTEPETHRAKYAWKRTTVATTLSRADAGTPESGTERERAMNCGCACLVCSCRSIRHSLQNAAFGAQRTWAVSSHAGGAIVSNAPTSAISSCSAFYASSRRSRRGRSPPVALAAPLPPPPSPARRVAGARFGAARARAGRARGGHVAVRRFQRNIQGNHRRGTELIVGSGAATAASAKPCARQSLHTVSTKCTCELCQLHDHGHIAHRPTPSWRQLPDTGAAPAHARTVNIGLVAL